jgi:hypothetical protein
MHIRLICTGLIMANEQPSFDEGRRPHQTQHPGNKLEAVRS